MGGASVCVCLCERWHVPINFRTHPNLFQVTSSTHKKLVKPRILIALIAIQLESHPSRWNQLCPFPVSPTPTVSLSLVSAPFHHNQTCITSPGHLCCYAGTYHRLSCRNSKTLCNSWLQRPYYCFSWHFKAPPTHSDLDVPASTTSTRVLPKIIYGSLID